MVTKSYGPLSRLVLDTWGVFVPITCYILLISLVDLTYHLEEHSMSIPMPLVAAPGTVIGLLLGFRTNSCYARWWEARIIWGAIVNDSRTWVRQMIEFTGAREPQGNGPSIQSMAYRQVAWCYTLSRSLRHQDPLEDVRQLLEDDELAELATQHNVPNALLLTQAVELRRLYREKCLETYQFVELEKTLTRLTDSMGGCERIKNTPFPMSYSFLVHSLTYFFIALLPFGLVEMPPAGMIVTSLLFALGFLVIDRVAIYLEDPFENRPSDTPMLTLSRTIEINIRQMLGEQDLPEKPEPVAGILY